MDLLPLGDADLRHLARESIDYDAVVDGVTVVGVVRGRAYECVPAFGSGGRAMA